MESKTLYAAIAIGALTISAVLARYGDFRASQSAQAAQTTGSSVQSKSNKAFEPFDPSVEISTDSAVTFPADI
jgi:hypothetical protein